MRPFPSRAGGSAGSPARRPRVVFLDTLRGLTIVSMVAFHTVYDLVFIFGFDIPWFVTGPARELWRISISWTFLILAGWMTSMSRDNLRRGLKYATAALLVWAATSVAAVDTPVSFGILFCMAASTLIWAALERILGRERLTAFSAAAIVLMPLLFTLTRDLPLNRYPIEGLAWLGLPSPTFRSGDYYPLLPYLFLYLLGGFGALLYRRQRKEHGIATYPAWMYRDWCPPLTAIGRHALIIYLAHQPLVLVVLELLLT